MDKPSESSRTDSPVRSVLCIDNNCDPDRTLQVLIEGSMQTLPSGFRMTIEAVGERPTEIHLVQRDEVIALRAGPHSTLCLVSISEKI